MPEQLVVFADGVVCGSSYYERDYHEMRNKKLKMRNEKVAGLIASFVFRHYSEQFQYWL